MAATEVFNVDNNGIGDEPLLSMKVDTTTNLDFTQTDLDNNLTACVISGNNEVGMGSAGDKLFGKVRWVSEEVDSNDIPVLCSVQARGVARFLYTDTAPSVGQMVQVDGTGQVQVADADADIAAGGHLAKGVVIAKDTTNTTVDVWLG